jgi:hypothetical protein
VAIGFLRHPAMDGEGRRATSTRHHPLSAQCLQYITSLYILSDSRAMREFRILFGFGPNPLPDKGLKNFPGHL